SGTQSVYLLRDLNHDGNALGPGESLVVAGPGNASGITLAAPSGIAFDPAGTLYVCNAGNSLGADAIYRLVDLDGDGRFMSANEIQPFVTTGAFGPGNGPFSPQEIAILPSPLQPIGYLHNSSAGLFGVFKFADLNNNGRADDQGEFTAYFDQTNASG